MKSIISDDKVGLILMESRDNDMLVSHEAATEILILRIDNVYLEILNRCFNSESDQCLWDQPDKHMYLAEPQIRDSIFKLREDILKGGNSYKPSSKCILIQPELNMTITLYIISDNNK